MRIKISFLKVHGSSGTVPLHHQKIISAFMDEVIREMPISSPFYNFSSLKGTSKVQNGQIRFLSSKVSLVLSAPDKEFAEEWVRRIFERRLVSFAKLTLVPKASEVIPDPDFNQVMKYVCISPMVPQGPFESDPEGNIPDPLDPREQDFSDAFYDVLMENMERAGFTPQQLHDFAEFEITPDPGYIQKILNTHKKFARIYKNNDSLPIFGYLLPFALHAHPQVQKFVWDCGIGMYTNQGYGMVDVVGGLSQRMAEEEDTSIGLLSQMGIPFGDEKIVFQDLSIHLAAPRTRAGDFNVFVLFGNSANDFQHKPDSAAIEAYKDVFDIDYTSRTLIAGAGWQKQLGRRTRIKAAHAHSGQVNDRIAQPGGIATGMYQKDYSDEQIAASSLSLSHHLPGRWRLDEGVSYVLKQYRYDIGRDSETSGGDFKTETVQPWAQASWASASGQTSVVAGVHGLLWLNETAIAEPRFSAVQRFGRRHSLSASWGIHSQTPAWWQYDGQLIRSSQTGLRYAWHSTDEAWRASLEGFWQTITDAAALFYPNGPVSVLNESEAPFPYFTGQKGQSEGRNYGVELGAEHRFAAGWFLLANATFFRAQTRLENRGWENSRWDLRRIVHLSGGKEWQKTTGERKTRAFGCSGRLTWSGGMRAMPVDLAASEVAAGTVFDAAAGFRVQQPDFFRLDGRVYWRTSIGDRRNSTFAMDFQNMTLRENVAYRYYDPWTKQVETKLQLGLIPNLSWRLEL